MNPESVYQGDHMKERTMQPLLIAVREHTRDAHRRLETALALLDRPLTLPRYRRLLRGFAGFYGPLEARLAAFPQWADVHIDYSQRRKLPWLVADLAALGDDSASIHQLPRCERLPPTDSFGQAVGCAYVLEGATLGGQHLARVVQAQLGLSADTGGRFFDSYGMRVPEMWRAFQDAMVRATRDVGQQYEVLDAAEQTFVALHRWMEPTMEVEP